MSKIRNLAEADLIREFGAGNTEALSQMMRKYRNSLTHFAQSYCKNEMLTEEFVADIFLKVWDRRTSFDSLEKIKAFLFISIKNACLDYLKSPEHKRSSNVDPHELDLAEEPEVYARILRSELLTVLNQEIEKLPMTQKTIVNLSHQEGKSYEEISKQLQVSKNAVYVNYWRAVKALRAALFKVNN